MSLLLANSNTFPIIEIAIQSQCKQRHCTKREGRRHSVSTHTSPKSYLIIIIVIIMQIVSTHINKRVYLNEIEGKQRENSNNNT